MRFPRVRLKVRGLLTVVAAVVMAGGWAVAAQAWEPLGEARKSMDRDIEVIDAYLAKWDRFARGERALVQELNRDAPEGLAALGRALGAKDLRAPARLVFLAIVQVGGGIPVDSNLGRAAAALLGPDFPVPEGKNGRAYFAGDLYFWWQDHRKDYEPYPLFEEWSRREFAQKTVIPMYKKLRESKRPGG